MPAIQACLSLRFLPWLVLPHSVMVARSRARHLFQASRPEEETVMRWAFGLNGVLFTKESTRCLVIDFEVSRLWSGVSVGLRIASPPVLTLCVRRLRYYPSILLVGIPMRLGRNLVLIIILSGSKDVPTSVMTRWTYCHSFCR